MVIKALHVQKIAYSAKEASEILGVSVGAVYDGIAQHQIPAVRIGRRILISKAALDKWLQSSLEEITLGGRK